MSMDPFVGRALDFNGTPYTVIGVVDWGSYYYLACQDEEKEVVIRPIAVVRRSFELGAEVDPNG